MNVFVDAKQIALLGIALAIGLLIGMERGWVSREVNEGERVAGLRTFGLTGLLGGVAGLLSGYLDVAVLGFIFLGFSGVVALAYTLRQRVSADAGVTSLITLLLTFVLGALATLDHVNLAVSAAVVTTFLLRFKHTLHSWLKKLEERELHAALLLLLISVVLLPALPNRGYGPWQVLNPYEIWWMVVLVAGISFVGYFTMKLAGTQKGVLLTALTAGLASSTALTLHFSRLSTKQKGMNNLFAAGILVACGTMFLRMLLISSFINPALFKLLIMPIAAMTAVTLFSAAVVWRKSAGGETGEFVRLINPLELKAALFFGALLVLVILLGELAIHYFGEAGIYVLALVSGIADVDPINLTLSRMSLTDLSLDVAVLGIVIASCANTLLKAGLAVAVGGAVLGVRVLVPLTMSVAAGLLTAWFI